MPEIPVDQTAVVTPPPGVSVYANFGPAAKSWPAGTPLPAGAVSWTYEGAPGWLALATYPWGRYTESEELQMRAERIARANLLAPGLVLGDARRVDKLARPDSGDD